MTDQPPCRFATAASRNHYNSLQLALWQQAPAIDVHIVQSLESPGGMGEAGISAIAPAVTNTIFAATGKRLRKLPIDAAT